MTNKEYSKEVVAKQKLRGGNIELQNLVYEALELAPEQVHSIINIFRKYADTSRYEAGAKVFRAFVVRTKFGNLVNLRHLEKEIFSKGY